MKKRIFSMLLAIVMVAGMIPGFAVTAGAAETIAVYFKNTQNWEKVYVYTCSKRRQLFP